VVLALAVVVAAVAVALAGGGSIAGLSTLPVRGLRLVVIALAAQLLGSGLARATSHSAFYSAGLALGALAVLAFCIRNLRLPGVPLVAAGLVLNAAVVAANGAMPVSTAAAARAGVSVGGIAAGGDTRHVISTRGTALAPLADVVPVPLPARGEVVSPGDVLVAAGLGELVVLGMRRRRRDPARAPRTSVATRGSSRTA
jgi:hypothetical protein